MPIYAEIIKNCPDQDASDLEILYPGESEQLLARAQSDKLLLIGGRFNGRLLGALTLTPIHGGDFEMARLTVRAITRRRGVARQLLIQTFKILPEELETLSADLGNAAELSELFTEMGFKAQGNTWRWQRP
ncbi:Acetyltransferase (GNAT) domain [Spongiibacter sp. IMCC21906]|uniref:acetyl-CoA sensor PanZ family protein n=1 Tax=Spongiibacter sp. IMCC21906 TaxID=1620392 RepID=UPI00062DFCCF|nr:acetyl-CoA sensor PanZ family protein [Spongiibacter sp. IMCC21906]AKH68508.1 Acetyltransferase (GNAT) domain [Spongiibacter sp. IMCC21906]